MVRWTQRPGANGRVALFYALFRTFPSLRWEVAMSFINGRRPHDAIRVFAAPPKKSRRSPARRVVFYGWHWKDSQKTPSRASIRIFWHAHETSSSGPSGSANAMPSSMRRNWRSIGWKPRFAGGYWNHPYVSKHSTVFRKLDGHPRFEAVLARMKSAWEQFEP